MALILNYAHPLSDDQLAQVTALLGAEPGVRAIVSAVDRERPIAEAALELVHAAHLTLVEWQTLPLILNPPALAPVALALIAELHGRCGYFPPILNIRPVANALPPRYEVAEIVNLQALRDKARARRSSRPPETSGSSS
jgi:hypothetical protein